MPLPGARRGDDPERGLRVYSREDGERILADLAASGLPGSPSRGSPRAWRGQAERGEPDVPGREVRGRCGHAKHGRHPEATRREAASLARGGMRPADVARRLGVSSGDVVASWLRGAAGGGSIAPGKGAVRVDGAAAEARVAEPEAELAEERLRRDALGEPVRDPKAGDPASPSNSQEAGLGERLRRGFGYRLADVPALLGISKSPCEYAGRANERAEARRAEVAGRVRHAFEASRRRCGYRRVGASVLSGADGLPTAEASEREVRRAMREGGMPSWKGPCGEGRVTRSMPRKGCCPDNARMEGFFGALKEGFRNGRDWSRTPPGGFIAALGEYTLWYRDERLGLFEEPDGSKAHDTIAGRRRRLGYAV